MPTPVLATKLYIPQPQPRAVLRPRLTERLNEGLQRKLTLISAPAGFGKTTLVGEWVAGCDHPVAWLSLDEGDSDPTRFLTYLVPHLAGASVPQGLSYFNVVWPLSIIALGLYLLFGRRTAAQG